MTVRELIAELQKCPQDYEVKTFDNHRCIKWLSASTIEVDDEDGEVWL